MSKVTEFISKHKTAVGLGAAGLILLWLLTRGSSSGGTSGGAVNPLQLAQLEAANNQQNAQIGAQEYATQTQAQLQQNQNNEALESEQDQLALPWWGPLTAHKRKSSKRPLPPLSMRI